MNLTVLTGYAAPDSAVAVASQSEAGAGAATLPTPGEVRPANAGKRQ
jgi:hypothetical protein